MRTGHRAGLRSPLPRPRLSVLFVFFLLLYVAVCASSYVEGDPTRNDFERFDDLRLTVAFFLLFAGLAAAYIALIEREDSPSWGVALLGAAAFALPLAFSFPIGSRDVFAYAFFGKMWGRYGLDPYLHPPRELASDEWFRFLQAWWTEATIAYGPAFTLQSRVVYWLSGDNLIGAVAAYKAIGVCLLAPSAWLVQRIRSRARTDGGAGVEQRAALYWLWSPLALFESVGSGHNDLTMTALALGAVALWILDHWLVAWVFLGISLAYKWYTAALLPVWIAWSIRRYGVAEARRQLVVGTLLLAATWAILLAPFLSSLLPIVERASSHDVTRLLFTTELPPPLWVLYHLYSVAGIMGLSAGKAIFDATRLAAFAAGLAWLVWRRRGSPYEAAAFVEDVFWSLVLFFSFVANILYPWHLLPVCAFALAIGGRGYERAAALITAVSLLSYFLTFAYAAILACLIAAALAIMRRGGPVQATVSR